MQKKKVKGIKGVKAEKVRARSEDQEARNKKQENEDQKLLERGSFLYVVYGSNSAPINKGCCMA